MQRGVYTDAHCLLNGYHKTIIWHRAMLSTLSYSSLAISLSSHPPHHHHHTISTPVFSFSSQPISVLPFYLSISLSAHLPLSPTGAFVCLHLEYSKLKGVVLFDRSRLLAGMLCA